ncbi:MAG: PilZ domain-containing protein [Magnetococcus sp. YQC-5]
MNEATPHQTSSNASHAWKQRLMRAHYDKEITLQMADGSILTGQAVNMNAKGFFINTDIKLLKPDLAGMHGTFWEVLHGENVSIPCQVVRITATGVGVQFVERS